MAEIQVYNKGMYSISISTYYVWMMCMDYEYVNIIVSVDNNYIEFYNSSTSRVHRFMV